MAKGFGRKNKTKGASSELFRELLKKKEASEPFRYGSAEAFGRESGIGRAPGQAVDKAAQEASEQETKQGTEGGAEADIAVKDFYDFLYFTGEYTGSALKGLLLLITNFFIYIYKKEKQLSSFLYHKADALFISYMRSLKEEAAYFLDEVHGARHSLGASFRESPKAFFSLLRLYVKKSTERYSGLFASVAHFLMPALALGVLLLTVNHWSTQTFALEVKSGGKNIGYISDEKVYIKAQNLVRERFDGNAKSSGPDLSTNYRVVTVEPNELSDSSTVSDSIIENSSSDNTFACGVYIDGAFICALKNETEAMQVFNNIIDEYKVDDENTAVGFVEDIKYEQGLYPDNPETIWDSERLASKLKEKKTAAKYYTVQTGDTLSQIAGANGTTVSRLYALNPGLKENIRAGDVILLANEVNYVRLKVVKTVVSDEEIPFGINRSTSPNLYKGTSKITRRGSKGLDRVTRLVTYVDGTQTNSQEINRVTIREPVAQELLIGTKRAVYGGSYQSSSYIRGSGSMVWPAVGCHMVTCRYGWTRWGYFHRGIDLAGGNAYGRTVVAAASGRVVSAGWHDSYGNNVLINHGNGLSTLYAHMASGTICVRPGQYVNAGSAIGKVGSTGYSTGAHLHFEVRINGRHVNPAPYIGA